MLDGQEVRSYTIIHSPHFEVALVVKILWCWGENLTKSIEAGLSSSTLEKWDSKGKRLSRVERRVISYLSDGCVQSIPIYLTYIL
jgi:hypothetical protein